jgi:predicted DNA-binding protein with PD1-like motif
MKQIDLTGSTLVVLERDEELLTVLATYAQDSNLKSAWLSGLGGAMRATLGFYDIETKSYQWKTFDKPLEILSLSGNLSMVEGKPYWHIHGVFSSSDYRTVGGHIKELTIGLTGELYITPLASTLIRTLDDRTGLNLIDPDQRA